MTRSQARLHPRLLGSALVGLAVFLLLPDGWLVNSRRLIAWDSGVVCYLSLTLIMAVRSSMAMMQKRASVEDEGAIAILIMTMAAAIASVTILCSWFFVHTIFAVHYAHEYYGEGGERKGVVFPHSNDPDYWDFLYFSFNLGAAAQTSDVAIVSKRMRRLALAHTILSFLFNTTILALAVNVGAGLI